MIKEEWKKCLVEDGVFRADGRFNPAWLTHRSKNYDWSELDGDSIPEKVYLLFNERKYCVICGKPTPFRNYSLAYPNTCSKECKRVFDSNTLKDKASKNCQSDSAKEKRKKTLENKYGEGVTNVFQISDVKDKIKDTLLKKYGVEHPAQNDNVINKMKETQFKKYNGWYTQTEDYKQKSKETCLKNFGSYTYFGSEDFKNKKEQYLIKNSVKSNMEIPEVLNKYLETMNLKYDVDWPMQNIQIRKKSLGKQSISGPEKKIEMFLANRGFNFESQYAVNNKCFDFAIFKDDKLSILIEVDGEYYHGLMEDPNDKHVKGFTDNERFLNTPEDVKLIVVDSKRVEEAFKEILDVFDLSYSEWIDTIVNSLPKDFPYKEYSSKRMIKDYTHLKEWENLKVKSRIGDSIITTYHKSIWSAHRKNLPSPLEAWSNNELLRKCVENRFIYSNHLSSQDILQGFNVCKLAPRISVFSASLSKYLILKYLNDYEEVFDPFSGFSGRLLGTCACDKNYIGQDINKEHIEESNKIIDFLSLNEIAKVSVQDVLTDTNHFYECLFTCPPYGGLEHWNALNDEIEKSCDEWIDVCLEKYDCKSYLFVVDNTEKYKDNIVEVLTNKSHLGENREYVVLF